MRAVELDTAASQAVDDFSAQTGLPLQIVGRLLGWFAIQEKGRQDRGGDASRDAGNTGTSTPQSHRANESSPERRACRAAIPRVVR